MGRDLISKFLAAGLSAGIFLFWWPEHHATNGLTSLIIRGALWTLAYELLLLTFIPLERMVRGAVKSKRRQKRLEERLARVPARTRVGGACALACLGIAAPLALLADAHAPKPARAAAPKKVVVVKREVVRQRVVVREKVVEVPAAAAHPAPRIVRVPAAEPSTERRTSKTSEPAESKAPSSTTPEDAAEETPTATTPQAAPAPTAAAPAAEAEASPPSPEG